MISDSCISTGHLIGNAQDDTAMLFEYRTLHREGIGRQGGRYPPNMRLVAGALSNWSVAYLSTGHRIARDHIEKA
eukprot:3941961-Rhodomonas_salina.16